MNQDDAPTERCEGVAARLSDDMSTLYVSFDGQIELSELKAWVQWSRGMAPKRKALRVVVEPWKERAS